MGIGLLGRARSYLSGGSRSELNKLDNDYERILELKILDKEMDSRINSMNNTQLVNLIGKAIGPIIDKILDEQEAAIRNAEREW